MSETTSNEAGAPRRTHRVYSLELKQRSCWRRCSPEAPYSAASRKHGINEVLSDPMRLELCDCFTNRRM
jgi:transposase